MKGQHSARAVQRAASLMYSCPFVKFVICCISVCRLQALIREIKKRGLDLLQVFKKMFFPSRRPSFWKVSHSQTHSTKQSSYLLVPDWPSSSDLCDQQHVFTACLSLSLQNCCCSLVFCFGPIRGKNSEDVCVWKSREISTPQKYNKPVWHQQSRHAPNHLDHSFYSPTFWCLM